MRMVGDGWVVGVDVGGLYNVVECAIEGGATYFCIFLGPAISNEEWHLIVGW